MRTNASIRAAQYTELMMLTKKDFDGVVAIFPEVRAKVMHVAEELQDKRMKAFNSAKEAAAAKELQARARRSRRGEGLDAPASAVAAMDSMAWLRHAYSKAIGRSRPGDSEGDEGIDLSSATPKDRAAYYWGMLRSAVLHQEG